MSTIFVEFSLFCRGVRGGGGGWWWFVVVVVGGGVRVFGAVGTSGAVGEGTSNDVSQNVWRAI
jgi:hypothetical protein